MKYADAARCPDCRAALEGRLRCAVCGFDVESPEVPEIWERLQQIDELLVTARARKVVPPPAAVVPAPTVPTSASGAVPPPIPIFASASAPPCV